MNGQNKKNMKVGKYHVLIDDYENFYDPWRDANSRKEFILSQFFISGDAINENICNIYDRLVFKLLELYHSFQMECLILTRSKRGKVYETEFTRLCKLVTSAKYYLLFGCQFEARC